MIWSSAESGAEGVVDLPSGCRVRGRALRTLREVRARLPAERVEIACSGGVGRTGTALAALCLLDGTDPAASVSWVRARYHRRAVEVPGQRWFLRWVWSEVDPGRARR